MRSSLAVYIQARAKIEVGPEAITISKRSMAILKSCLVATFSLCLTAAVPAQQPVASPVPEVQKAGSPTEKAVSRYLRVRRNDKDEPIALETSIVRFQPKDGSDQDFSVDLVGAVHVADAKYFRELNELFRQYDVLLYELVAPEEANVPTDGKSSHPVGKMQMGLKSMLKLDFQLERIDYTKDNFVHADMTPDEFSRAMADRGESFLQMMLRMLGRAMATQSSAQGSSSDAQLLLAFFSPRRSLYLKRIMSEQFEDLEGAMNAIEGPDGSTLISERNKKALSVLRRQLATGKKRVGIFYGAGHMPDMASRLEAEFDLHADGQRWLTAWDMR